MDDELELRQDLARTLGVDVADILSYARRLSDYDVVLVNYQKHTHVVRTPGNVLLEDDLTIITGIGKVTAERLRAAGITTFAALAAADLDEVLRITKSHQSSVLAWQEDARNRA